MRVDRVTLITEMAKRDISVEKLARMSGLSRVTISNVRSGKSCAENTASRIASTLSIPLESLTCKEELDDER